MVTKVAGQNSLSALFAGAVLEHYPVFDVYALIFLKMLVR
jgi:hypothetical protein